MLGNIKEGAIQVGGSDMHYLAFGSGTTPLVIIPGLGDGIRPVKGTGLVMRMIFRKYAKYFRVWIFSRKNHLEPGFTTREMAREQAEAMEKLNIQSACVLGVSQGGMISQWLAIDHPQAVTKLVIAVSLSRQNKIIQEVVRNWIEMAEQERYGDLAVDTLEKTYTQHNLRKWRPFYFLVRKTGKPVSKERFLIQANSCLTHDSYGELPKITCPTLVIGGGADQIVGGEEVQLELVNALPQGKLILYKDLGHGAYSEAKDFNARVLEFLK